MMKLSSCCLTAVTCHCLLLLVSQDIHSQGEVISCLEKALVREAEQQDHIRPIKEECQRAILRVAELSSDDFHLDRHLYFSCRDDRERFCQNVRRDKRRFLCLDHTETIPYWGSDTLLMSSRCHFLPLLRCL